MDRGGEGVFFRREIGLTEHIKIKDVKTGEVIEERLDFEHRTKLNLELEICSKYLGGMLHKDFKKLPREEKLKWYLFREMEMKREEYFIKKQQEALNKARSK